MILNTKENDLEKFIQIQKKIVPELANKLIERYGILRCIYFNQPIGRRNLSQVMAISERVVRAEVNFLKEQGFVEIKSEGMNTTEDGDNILEDLRSIIHSFKELSYFEEKVAKKLKIKKVIIVPSIDQSNEVNLKDIGRVTANYIRLILKNDMVLALTGGETMAMVADGMTAESNKRLNITVVPGRGGMGKEVERQANTIAAQVAIKLKATYKLLYMPDNISKDIFTTLSEEPSIKEVMSYINKADLLVFGIGRADKMARRRELGEDEIDGLLNKGAVAEAFGYYFNKNGDIVHEVNTVGVKLEYYKKMKNIVTAAAGAEKAEAIVAISKLNNNLVLVIDEILAEEILKF